MLLTIEISVDDDFWSRPRENFKKGLLRDVLHAAANRAEEHDVTVKRVQLVPNRSKKGKGGSTPPSTVPPHHHAE